MAAAIYGCLKGLAIGRLLGIKERAAQRMWKNNKNSDMPIDIPIKETEKRDRKKI